MDVREVNIFCFIFFLNSHCYFFTFFLFGYSKSMLIFFFIELWFFLLGPSLENFFFILISYRRLWVHQVTLN